MKVFGIGLNKTGTTTLAECFRHLGFRHASVNLELTRCVRRGDLDPVFACADRFDSFEDWPWPLIYRQLDERYPGAKFVLTIRVDSEAWLNSIKKHARAMGPTEFREVAYGHAMPEGHEAEYLAVYERHNREVRDYFRDRPADLLEVCWETGSGWRELCGFLGRDIPDVPFPHANRRAENTRRILINRTKRLARDRILRRSG